MTQEKEKRSLYYYENMNNPYQSYEANFLRATSILCNIKRQLPKKTNNHDHEKEDSLSRKKYMVRSMARRNYGVKTLNYLIKPLDCG